MGANSPLTTALRAVFVMGLFCSTLIPLGAARTVVTRGVNIAGFEFGCLTDGTCPPQPSHAPLLSLGGADGVGQMQHFAKDDKMNVFRLPVSWQFLVNNVPGGKLDDTNFGKYDQLMQACLGAGAYCVLDIHNYGRWNGQIIGQTTNGPTNAQFADLWTQLATKYKKKSKVIFGLMNEPHDLDLNKWVITLQLAVNAIRGTGSKKQWISLPGLNYANAGAFINDGSGAALLNIKNPDSTTNTLIFDIHQYLDSDATGTHAECATDNVKNVFNKLGPWLRTNKRLALLTETGGGNTTSCLTDLCSQNVFLNQNSDVFLGYIGWAAGSFATTYVLSLTPTKVNGKYIDQAIVSKCIVGPFVTGAVSPSRV